MHFIGVLYAALGGTLSLGFETSAVGSVCTQCLRVLLLLSQPPVGGMSVLLIPFGCYCGGAIPFGHKCGLFQPALRIVIPFKSSSSGPLLSCAAGKPEVHLLFATPTSR